MNADDLKANVQGLHQLRNDLKESILREIERLEVIRQVRMEESNHRS